MNISYDKRIPNSEINLLKKELLFENPIKNNRKCDSEFFNKFDFLFENLNNCRMVNFNRKLFFQSCIMHR